MVTGVGMEEVDEVGVIKEMGVVMGVVRRRSRSSSLSGFVTHQWSNSCSHLLAPHHQARWSHNTWHH